MKIFILFLLLLFVSCESGNDCDGGYTISKEEMADKYDVTYEELTVKYQGTYQTEEEVWYKGEFGVLTFYLKMDEQQPIRTLEICGGEGLLRVPTLLQANDGILYDGSVSKTRIYTEAEAPYGGLEIENSEYESCNIDDEGNFKWVLIKKISDEIPAELSWEYTECSYEGICE